MESFEAGLTYLLEDLLVSCGDSDLFITSKIFLFNISNDILDFMHISLSHELPFILPTG